MMIFKLISTMFSILLLAGTALPDEHRTPVKGKVQAINRPGTIAVTIDIGSDAGVMLFDDCDILRNDAVIGSLHVTTIAADHSTAEITSLLPTLAIDQGDPVLFDFTMQYLKQLRLDSQVSDPVELGRAHARLDVQGELRRILYCGRPWSDGKPLIDDETGYPVQIAAGCTVTNDLLRFVESYNSTLRDSFKKMNDEKARVDDRNIKESDQEDTLPR